VPECNDRDFALGMAQDGIKWQSDRIYLSLDVARSGNVSTFEQMANKGGIRPKIIQHSAVQLLDV